MFNSVAIRQLTYLITLLTYLLSKPEASQLHNDQTYAGSAWYNQGRAANKADCARAVKATDTGSKRQRQKKLCSCF